MLLELSIENFAIIDKVRINFTEGLNVLTGETGAGKSIIIDAISLVLGGRADKEYVRNGCQKTTIEALFTTDKISEIDEVLKEYGIENESENFLIITREIFSSGRSTSRINGRAVTLSMLNSITNKLIDIHGQHDHQSLLKSDKHSDFIDSLGDENLRRLKENIKTEFEKLQTIKARLKELVNDEMEKERKIDLLKFQIEEIDEAKLIEGEENELEKEYNILSNSENIMKVLSEVVTSLDSDYYNNSSVLDKLNYILVNLNKIAKHDNEILNFANIVESSIYQLEDLHREVRTYLERIEYNPQRIEYLSERIDLINKLKRKYGKTIKDILQYREEIEKELTELLNCEKEIDNLKKSIVEHEYKLNTYCQKLTKLRTSISQKFEEDIIRELKEVNMTNVKFKVSIEQLKDFTKNGLDKIEFLVSTNPSEPLKSLSKIVSGGEMSRIMLAFKSILAEIDEIPTLIFDEIDTGISGRTAQIVGEKISKLSNNRQIICITHLPQIAALSDSHYLISKKIVDNKSVTEIYKLNYDERIEEMSRLLGGVALTETTKQHAKEMIEMSKKINFNKSKNI